jgi:hypothetical protein
MQRTRFHCTRPRCAALRCSPSCLTPTPCLPLQQLIDLSVSAWEACPEDPSRQQRSIRYTKPINKPMAPPTAPVVEEHTVMVGYAAGSWT